MLSPTRVPFWEPTVDTPPRPESSWIRPLHLSTRATRGISGDCFLRFFQCHGPESKSNPAFYRTAKTGSGFFATRMAWEKALFGVGFRGETKTVSRADKPSVPFSGNLRVISPDPIEAGLPLFWQTSVENQSTRDCDAVCQDFPLHSQKYHTIQ